MQIRQVWDKWVKEPCQWLFFALFQPHRFRRESGNLEHSIRIAQMRRLALPLFLCAFLITLFFELLFISIDAKLFGFNMLQALFNTGLPLLGETGEGVGLGIALGVVIGIKTENVSGITACLLWGTLFGLLSGMFFPVIDIWNFVYKLFAAGGQQNGIGGSLLLGPEAVLSSALRGAFMGLIAGIVARMSVKGGAGELARGTLWGFVTGFIISLLIPDSRLLSLPALVMITFVVGCGGSYIEALSRSRVYEVLSNSRVYEALSNNRVYKMLFQFRNSKLYITGGALGLLTGGIAGVIWWIDVSIRGTSSNLLSLLIEVLIGLIAGGIMGLLLSVILTPFLLNRKSLFYSEIGIIIFFILLMYYSYYAYLYSDYSAYASIYSHSTLANSYYSYYLPIFCATLFLAGLIMGLLKPQVRFSIVIVMFSSLVVFSLAYGSLSNLLLALWPLATFISGCLAGYFRLPLYPISSISMSRTASNCKKDPTNALFWLQHSSLHWDEHTSFPLPDLEQLLLTALDRDKSKAVQEIYFIAEQRPQQISQTRAAIVEVVLKELEGCGTFSTIAQFSSRFKTLVPLQIRTMSPEWILPFDRLRDASAEVERSYTIPTARLQRNALNAAATHLKKLQPQTAFSDISSNERLQNIVNTWQEIVFYQLEKPEQNLEIENPYFAGKVLDLGNKLFKGRKDLAREIALHLNSNANRLPFLLYGERRMGKSSILKHLPSFLEERYLPIFFDLQSRDISSSIDVFFAELARSIVQKMQSSGMKVQGLDPADLERAARKNEANVYYVFNNWLMNVERLLDGEERILLLAFDEFEKLEKAAKDGFLDLSLLLDWFRNIIQYQPRMVLLFSVLSASSETGNDWADYFVNAKSLKVSFLHPDEARELITKPVPSFPEMTFGPEVTEEILRVTHSHPFLVQAVCQDLINHLNEENRQNAVCADVMIAVNAVIKDWKFIFNNLWDRTSNEQRSCLKALITLKQGDTHAIVQHTGCSYNIVHECLEKLLNRDLVIRDEQGVYQISVPIFSLWVERFGLTADK